MRVSTALNHQNRAIRRVKAIYSAARVFKTPAKDITVRLNEVMDSIAHCPTHVTSFVSGYAACLAELHWLEMEFCYLIDDVWHSTHRESDKPPVPAQDMRGKLCCFMYKGTMKMYTEPDVVS